MSEYARAFVVTVAIAACKHDPPQPGEQVTFDTVCTAKYAETGDLAKTVRKRVTLEGYLGISKLMTCSDESCSVELFATPALDGTHVSAYLGVGDGANEMSKLPESFTPADVKLHASNGKTLGLGAKLRVTGWRMGAATEKVCAIDHVDLVEAL